VTLALQRRADDALLEVRDDGVGMTQEVLTRSLLDFGAPFWDSQEEIRQLPGLEGTTFRAVGRFGIGFFAAFMWSENVTVITRPRLGSSDDTRVLEFSGLTKRPVLRPADNSEQLPTQGTVVRLKLPSTDLSSLDPPRHERPDQPRDKAPTEPDLIVGWVAPGSEVDLLVEEGHQTRKIVRAGDWKRISPERLVARVAGIQVSDLKKRAVGSQIVELFRPIKQDGRLVGRAALLPELSRWSEPMAALVIGGLRVAPCEEIAGLLLGGDPNLARTEGRPIATKATLTRWMEEQAQLLSTMELSLRTRLEVAAKLAACAADTASLPICVSAEGPLDAGALRDWARAREDHAVYLFDGLGARDVSDLAKDDLSPAEDVLIVEWFAEAPSWWRNAEGDFEGESISDRCMSIISEAWGGLEDYGSSDPQLIGVGRLGEVTSEYYRTLLREPDELDFGLEGERQSPPAERRQEELSEDTAVHEDDVPF